MLDDVPGLINPIIQAMIATSHSQKDQQDIELRKQQLKQQADYQKAESAHADATLAETQRQHDQMMQYNRDMLEKVHIPQIQALMEKQGIDALLAKTQARGAGVDLNSALPMGSGSPQGGPIDQNAGIPDQASQQAAVLNELRQKAGIQAQAPIEAQLSEPGQQLFARMQAAQKEEEDRKNAFQTQLEGLKETREDNRNKVQQAGMMSRVQQEGANQIALQKFKLNYGMDDTTGMRASKANQNVDAIFNGNTDPSKLPKQDLEDAINFAAQNHENLPLGQAWKDYKSVLDSTGKLQALTNQATDFANKYSADSPGSGTAGNHYMNMGQFLGTRGYVAPGSATDTAHNGLMQSAGQYVKQLEGMSRTSDPNLIRQISAVGNPGTTMQQNKDNIQQVLQLGNQNLRDQTAGIPINRLHNALASRGIVDFGGQNTPAAYKKVVNGFGTNDGIHTFNVQTGKEVDPITGVPK